MRFSNGNSFGECGTATGGGTETGHPWLLAVQRLPHALQALIR